MSDQLSEFLDVAVGDVKMPVDLPTGTYKFVVQRYSVERADNQNKTVYVLASLKPIEVQDAEDDVDLNNVRNIQHKFWHTDKADKIMVRFLTKALKLEAKPETLLSQLWEQALGVEVIGQVKTEVKQGKNGPYTEINIERFFPAD